MKRQINLVLSLLAVQGIFAEDHEYCALKSCPNRTHTLCQYPDSGAASSCGNSVRRGLTEDQKRIILNAYNRNIPSVTLYEEGDDFQSQNNRVTLVYGMRWDEELERIAQRWADQCIDTKDVCRNVERFDVRQRVLSERVVGLGNGLMHLLISHWINEDRSPILNDLRFQGVTIEDTAISIANHYERLMSLHENRIGCGATIASSVLYDIFYLVCNFGIQE